MKIVDTKINDVKIIEPKVFGDARGFFLETFQAERYKNALGIDLEFVQDNHSRSAKGVLRGLHLQKIKPQGKLVRVVQGAVFDVAVDVRPNSKTFGQWVGVELSADNHKQLWVPPGFAHGFEVLTEFADFEYKCSDYYDPNDELCLKWDDSTVAVSWHTKEPMISEKDCAGLPLASIKEQLLRAGV